MTKKFEARYSFVINVEAKDSQDAVNKANEIVKKDIEKYGPGCIDVVKSAHLHNQKTLFPVH